MPAGPTVDWGFISAEEGGQQLHGYVPMPETSQSGVTIATGFDIGQRGAAGIEALDVPESLKEKMKPYCGLKRSDAVAALDRAPLTITRQEANALDRAAKAEALEALRRAYDGSMSGDCDSFDALPGAAQTVIASVAFQYGVNLDQRTPRFWRAATARDWGSAVAELRDFGDRFPSRRNREADLLETILV